MNYISSGIIFALEIHFLKHFSYFLRFLGLRAQFFGFTGAKL
jgi:hypothetical protein